MQDVLEELIRWLGYLTRRLVTFGRYTGGSSGDRLRDGAFGLALIAVPTYAAVVF